MPAGLNADDFSKRFATADLKANPNGKASVTDPVDDALAVNRKVIASRMLDSSVASLGVDKLEADLKRTELEIKKQQLDELRTPTSAAPDGYVAFLTNQLDRSQAQLAEAQDRALSAQQEVLNQQVGMLRSELERMRAKANENAQGEQIDPLDLVAKHIESAEKIMSIVHPPVAPNEPVLGYDPGFEKYKIMVQDQAEARRLEFEERRWVTEQELQLKREVALAEAQAINAKAQAESRFFEKSVPVLIDLGQQLIKAVQNLPAASAPTVAGATAPPHTQAPPKALPEGVIADNCEKCGFLLYIRPGFGGVICPNCLEVYEFQSADAPPPTSINGRAAGTPIHPTTGQPVMPPEPQHADAGGMGEDLTRGNSRDRAMAALAKAVG